MAIFDVPKNQLNLNVFSMIGGWDRRSSQCLPKSSLIINHNYKIIHEYPNISINISKNQHVHSQFPFYPNRIIVDLSPTPHGHGTSPFQVFIVGAFRSTAAAARAL